MKRVYLILIFLFALIVILGTGCEFGASAKINKQIDLSVKYLNENNYEEAILAYREVIKIDPKNPIGYEGLNLAYSLCGKGAEAEKALQDGLAIIPENKNLQLALAGFYCDNGQKDKAEGIYKDVIAGDSKYISSYRAYYRLLASQGRYEEAASTLEKAAGIIEIRTAILPLLAEAYLGAGNKDKAQSAIIESISQEPNQWASYKLLKRMYNNHWQDLIALGDSYIQQNQGNIGNLLKIWGLYGSGKYDEVALYCQHINSPSTDSPVVKLLLAMSRFESGQKEQCIKEIKDINIKDIKDSSLLAEIARLSLDAGDKKLAREFAQKGIEMDETVSENYLVMFGSYREEDSAQADAWLLRNLLASPYGLKQARTQQLSNMDRAITKSDKDLWKGSQLSDAMEAANKGTFWGTVHQSSAIREYVQYFGKKLIVVHTYRLAGGGGGTHVINYVDPDSNEVLGQSVMKNISKEEWDNMERESEKARQEQKQQEESEKRERSARAKELLFAYQPSWRELERQGKRKVNDYPQYSTFIIEELSDQGKSDGLVHFHVYEIMESPAEGHTATWGWLGVNPETREIFDDISPNGKRVYP